ncbi:phage integrase family protein [Burkholderia sp. GbtcB21]|uniref:phage integrase family protein n=1 Tax=Burkholderia sp. GbtcB21 TaxID=2824766 RepID=UPI0034D576C2
MPARPAGGGADAHGGESCRGHRKAQTLAGCFDAKLVARLAAAGVATFADLLALVRARRRCWYRVVPRLGERRTQRVTDFIAQHPDTLVYL